MSNDQTDYFHKINMIKIKISPDMAGFCFKAFTETQCFKDTLMYKIITQKVYYIQRWF